MKTKINCHKCNKEFEQKMLHQKFCSIKCRQSYHAKNYLQKSRIACPGCKNLMAHDSLKCRKCSYETEIIKNSTIEEYQNRESVKNKHPSWKNHHIRLFAKSWNLHLFGKPCKNCGYTKHTEFCHVQSISSFPPETKLGIINSESNIIMLCPNCHWEFDNGFLKI